jgi:pimeloyl-ACP methyl ester carboxylesterase
VDGVLLHFKERGDRGAPAVLLLHGFNGRSATPPTAQHHD